MKQKVPIFTCLPKFRLDMEKIGCKAYTAGIYAVDSQEAKLTYACNGGRLALITPTSGYVVLKMEQIPGILCELQELLDDLEWRKRAGVKES